MPCGNLEEGEVEQATSTEAYSYVHKWGSDIDGPHEETLEGYSFVEQSYRRTHGVCTPNFHARQKAGELLPHTYFEQFESSSFATGSFDYHADIPGSSTNAWFEYVSPNIPSFFFSGDPGKRFWLREDEVKAYLEDREFTYDVQKAAARIYTQGHDSLTFLAELAKTRQLFANIVKGMLGFKPKLSKLKPQTVNGIKSIPGKWLEARYGLRPLLYDLNDLQDAMENMRSERKRYSERSGSSYSNNSVSTISTTPDATYGRWLDYITTDTVIIGTRGSVQADIQPANFQFAPILTAWELMPFSFILDWLVNVGQSLAAIHFLTLNSQYVASGGLQCRVERRVERVWHSGSMTGFTKANGYGLGVYSTRIPTSVSSIPQVRARLDAFKIADLLAIIYQLFNRR